MKSVFSHRLNPKNAIASFGRKQAKKPNQRSTARVSFSPFGKKSPPTTINRSFSSQAERRFNVLKVETSRHIEALMLTFGCQIGDGLGGNLICLRFVEMFDAKVSVLLSKIVHVEDEYGNGSFGQNPKEKWGVFQEEVDELVSSLYDFIEWMSREIVGGMSSSATSSTDSRSEVSRIYILSEMLDAIFGAVYTSKQGLKHVWNKGILDKKQDFFCLSKILDRFPELKKYCDEVAQGRMGPDKNMSWTEVVQDLRNIRLRATGHHFGCLKNECSSASASPRSVDVSECNDRQTHEDLSAKSTISSIKDEEFQDSMEDVTVECVTEEDAGSIPVENACPPQTEFSNADPPLETYSADDFSMEDITKFAHVQSVPPETSCATLRPSFAFGNCSTSGFGAPQPYGESTSFFAFGPNITNAENCAARGDVSNNWSCAIPHGSQEFLRLSSTMWRPPDVNLRPPPTYSTGGVDHAPALDQATLHQILNQEDDFDMDLGQNNFGDENGDCIFDVNLSMPTLLNSMEEMQLANLAVNGKLSNDSL